MSVNLTEDILARLRGGGVMLCARRTGKTTALVMLAKELMPNVVLVVENEQQKEYVKRLWVALQADRSPCPEGVVVCGDARCIVPPRRKVLVDELTRCDASWVRLCFAATESYLGEGGGA